MPRAVGRAWAHPKEGRANRAASQAMVLRDLRISTPGKSAAKCCTDDVSHGVWKPAARGGRLERSPGKSYWVGAAAGAGCWTAGGAAAASGGAAAASGEAFAGAGVAAGDLK